MKQVEKTQRNGSKWRTDRKNKQERAKFERNEA
jgi:hypothetical protein